MEQCSLSYRHTHIWTLHQHTIAAVKAWKSFTEVYFKLSAVCVMVQEQTLQVEVKAVGARDWNVQT